MLRHISAYAVLLLVFSPWADSASAQSTARTDKVPSPGTWIGGQWFGYRPTQLKYGGRASQPPASSARNAAPEELATTTADPSDGNVRLIGPTGESRGVVAAAGNASRGRREITPAAYEEMMPSFDEPAFVDEGGAMSAGCDSCGGCGSPCEGDCGYGSGRPGYCGTGEYWVRAEYLGWWTSGMVTPALVTTSTAGTAQAQAGVLGQPNTSILFGDAGLTRDGRSGGRYALGIWLDPCRQHGFEAIYMSLGTETETFRASDSDYTIVGRPFFNLVTGLEDARLIVFPNVSDGSVSVTAETEFQGGELLWRRGSSPDSCNRTDFLLGYRWAELNDRLRITEATTSRTVAAPGATIALFDLFDTSNDFHGVELGVDLQRPLMPCWSVEVLGKMALGNSSSTVLIDGQTTTTPAGGAAAVTAGGLLAQPTNIGRYERNSLAAILELGVSLRRHFNSGLEATFGYTLVYWSDVARPGDQIDRDINVSQLPPGPLVGAPRPEFLFHQTDFWAQGLHAGLEYTF